MTTSTTPFSFVSLSLSLSLFLSILFLFLYFPVPPSFLLSPSFPKFSSTRRGYTSIQRRSLWSRDFQLKCAFTMNSTQFRFATSPQPMQILVLKRGGRKALHQGSTPLSAGRLYRLSVRTIKSSDCGFHSREFKRVN